MSEQVEVNKIQKKILKTGIGIGTSVKTKFMIPFITGMNDDKVYRIDIKKTLARIQTAARFINRVGADNLIVCSSQEYVETPIEKFCMMVGAKKLFGRFMPGTLTNPSLPNYIEPKLVLISDPQIDDQAVIEATNAGIPVIGISDTDNITSNLDIIIPANNRGRKAIATAYWLLAYYILVERGELDENDMPKYDIDDFETKIIEGKNE